MPTRISPGLELVQQSVIVGSGAVLRDNFYAFPVVFFRIGFHAGAIIASVRKMPQGAAWHRLPAAPVPFHLHSNASAFYFVITNRQRQRQRLLPHHSADARLRSVSTHFGRRKMFLGRKVYLPILAMRRHLAGGLPQRQSGFQAGRKAEASRITTPRSCTTKAPCTPSPPTPNTNSAPPRCAWTPGNSTWSRRKSARTRATCSWRSRSSKRPQAIDPSNAAADQEIKKTMSMIAAKSAADASTRVNPNPSDDGDLLSGPPALKPISTEPINLKMTNDARVVYETIAKLAGLSVIFDPDFTSRRISVELPNVTLEQALDAVSLESKAFWKPLTPSVIFVAPDNPQKRRDVEDEEVRTFYLSNTLTPQDLTEIVTGLRQLLDLRRVQQVNAQNAIVIRDTPDKLLLASKIIRDIDKAKPEVLIHVQVLSANRDRLRNLGILPGQSATLTFNPRCAVQPEHFNEHDVQLNDHQHHAHPPARRPDYAEQFEESLYGGLQPDAARRGSHGHPHRQQHADHSGPGGARQRRAERRRSRSDSAFRWRRAASRPASAWESAAAQAW